MERARIWHPAILGEPELLRARRVTHRFPRHTHEGYGFGVIEHGALGFRYRGEELVAPAGTINLVVPDEPHTGQPAVADGWAYRMFYLGADLMGRAHRALAPAAGLPQFRAGVLRDENLAARLGALHEAIELASAPRLELEIRFVALLKDFIRRHASHRPDGDRSRDAPRELACAREYLREHYADEVRLDHLAAITGLSPWHLARTFARAFGVPPHAYQLQLRVGEARRLLARGQAAADVAAATGFTDQSHLIRHFKRLTGMTPGRYRKNVQD